ncbi:MAG: hypothetical protein JXR77_11015 [Lentisphaeria bacterium]|nr:hypothetical protein [Lentisphaeria bacterium]
MDRDLVLSVYQGPCIEGDFAANLAAAREVVQTALGRGSDFLAFPEAFLSGYENRGAVEAGARPMDDPALRAFVSGSAAHAMVILVGMARRAAEGLFNSVLVIHRGAVLGVYDKAAGNARLRPPRGNRPGTALRGRLLPGRVPLAGPALGALRQDLGQPVRPVCPCRPLLPAVPSRRHRHRSRTPALPPGPRRAGRPASAERPARGGHTAADSGRAVRPLRRCRDSPLHAARPHGHPARSECRLLPDSPPGPQPPVPLEPEVSAVSCPPWSPRSPRYPFPRRRTGVSPPSTAPLAPVDGRGPGAGPWRPPDAGAPGSRS